MGRKFLASPYYSQRAVFVSLRALFSLILLSSLAVRFNVKLWIMHVLMSIKCLPVTDRVLYQNWRWWMRLRTNCVVR